MNETMAQGRSLRTDAPRAISASSGGSRWIRSLAKWIVVRRLSRLRRGRITICDGHERTTLGTRTDQKSLEATITVYDSRTYVDVAVGGSVGAGDAYRRGAWVADNLTTVIRLFALNRELVDGLEGGLAVVSRPLMKWMHWLHRNTKAGSRRNIAAHYDLGNDLFQLMLDETMMYSCAYFERPDMTLADASREKNDLICRKLSLASTDHLLEIGTGWGGFALHAAAHYGCRVTTATISQHQYDLAVRRINSEGLSDRVQVLKCDYRDLPALENRFDKLVSIEMIEAIGHRQYESFFRVCAQMLKPTGMMLMQGITIDERFYARATRSVDFIQQFIFPGSCIPSISALTRACGAGSDLALIHLEDIGAHYALTLRAWRHNLARARPRLRALGYTPEFLRLWEFYLCYCEGGFLERSIGTAQLLFSKPDWRPLPIGC